MVTTLDLIAPHVGTLPSLSMTLPYVDYFMPSIEEAEIISKLFGPVGKKPFHLIFMYYYLLLIRIIIIIIIFIIIFLFISFLLFLLLFTINMYCAL